jgi:hypothetical protein
MITGYHNMITSNDARNETQIRIYKFIRQLKKSLYVQLYRIEYKRGSQWVLWAIYEDYKLAMVDFRILRGDI